MAVFTTVTQGLGLHPAVTPSQKSLVPDMKIKASRFKRHLGLGLEAAYINSTYMGKGVPSLSRGDKTFSRKSLSEERLGSR